MAAGNVIEGREETIRVFNKYVVPLIEERLVRTANSMSHNSCVRAGYCGPAKDYDFIYRDRPLNYLIGSGHYDEYSDWFYESRCCLEKPCCLIGQKVKVKAKCKVLNELWDKFQFDDYPQ